MDVVVIGRNRSERSKHPLILGPQIRRILGITGMIAG